MPRGALLLVLATAVTATACDAALPGPGTPSSRPAATAPAPGTTGAAPAATATTPPLRHGFPANPSHLPQPAAPGSQLHYGQAAVVTRPDPGGGAPSGRVYLRVTVTQVVRGDQSILSDVANRRAFPGGTIYYLRYRQTVLAMTGAAHRHGIAPQPGLVVVDARGGSFASLVGFDDGRCRTAPRYDELFVGSDVRGCQVVVGRRGQVPAAVATLFTRSAASSASDPYRSHPVFWRP